MDKVEEDYFPERHEPDICINDCLERKDAIFYEPGIRRSLTYYRAQRIENLDERISFLRQRLTEYRQGIRHPYEFYDEYDFDRCISLEIRYLQGEAKKSNESTKIDFYKYECDYPLITDFYNFCMKHKIFNYGFIDFIKRIETANFYLDEHILYKKKFLGLIYRLSYHMPKEWYTEVSKNMGIPKRRFGGLDPLLNKDNLLHQLHGIFKKHTKES